MELDITTAPAKTIAIGSDTLELTSGGIQIRIAEGPGGIILEQEISPGKKWLLSLHVKIEETSV